MLVIFLDPWGIIRMEFFFQRFRDDSLDVLCDKRAVTLLSSLFAHSDDKPIHPTTIEKKTAVAPQLL